MKSIVLRAIVGLVLVATAATAVACILMQAAILTGAAVPNVLPDHPWPSNTLTGWWFSFAGSIFTAVVGSYITFCVVFIIGDWLGDKATN